MELNLTTFILEIVNFLILVYLLAHFLYKPVLSIIARRQEMIQKKLEEAESTRNEADLFRSQYEDRLNDWKKERENARKELSREINDERKQLLLELQHELAQEQEKTRVLVQRKIDENLKHNEKLALQQGAAFTTKLLSRLAGPELEAGIVQLVIEDLGMLSADQQHSLNNNFGEDKSDIIICSAYPLSTPKRDKLQTLLAGIISVPVKCTYDQAPDLIAGLRIAIGPWNLQASLKDELKFFAESSSGTW